MYVVVTYDISEDKRRTQIHKILSSYGQWMQFSVFECRLSPTEYTKLRNRLRYRDKNLKREAEYQSMRGIDSLEGEREG